MVYLPHWPIPGSFGNREIDFERVFERISAVLEKLDNPHKKMPPVIHITGTNGKGSTASFLREILSQNGYKVDLYSSPHIHNCNERIIIGGIEISDSYLYEILEEVRINSSEIGLTFFEALTIAAFLAFSRSKSDISIIEVGMGGRIDATNIIEKKLSTIITPISYDHQEYLGDKIVKIAYEKAFIMRENTNLILGPQPKEALEIIELMANDQNVNLIKYDQDFEIEIDEDSHNFNFKSKDKIFHNLSQPSLQGQHQYINFSVALACVSNLEGFNITENSIHKSLKSTFWPSRLEKIENNFTKKLKENSEVYIDGAHNIGGAFALKKWFLEQKNTKKNFVIVGFSRDKAKANFLEQFKDVTDKIIAVRVDGEPYPESSEKIFEVGENADIKINPQDDLLDAFHYLLKNYSDEEIRIVICGSLHLARDVKKFGNLQ